jgi:hypothetical protein
MSTVSYRRVLAAASTPSSKVDNAVLKATAGPGTTTFFVRLADQAASSAAAAPAIRRATTGCNTCELAFPQFKPVSRATRNGHSSRMPYRGPEATPCEPTGHDHRRPVAAAFAQVKSMTTGRVHDRPAGGRTVAASRPCAMITPREPSEAATTKRRRGPVCGQQR